MKKGRDLGKETLSLSPNKLLSLFNLWDVPFYDEKRTTERIKIKNVNVAETLDADDGSS